MKLEEGKWYVTREPEHSPVRVIRRAPTSLPLPPELLLNEQPWPWLGDNGHTYTADGRECTWADSAFDIVAEVPDEVPKLQLQEGKWYVTRDQKRGPVTVTSRHCNECGYPWKGSNGELYTTDGHANLCTETALDLVAEVPKLQLEEGKLYQPRNHNYEPVRVTRRQYYSGEFPWIGDNNVTYSANGGTFLLNDSPYDLVAESPAPDQRANWTAEYRVEIEKQQDVSDSVIRDHEECERFVAGVAKQAREDFWFRKHTAAGNRAQEIENARRDFEVWAETREFTSDRDINGEYKSTFSRHAWAAFLSARGLA